ncbi:MAG: hypothetical protein ACREI7_05585 [Myxococcota bacterium]
MPLAAQYAEEQPQAAAEVEVQDDSLDVDVDLKDDAGNIDPEIDVKTGAEARADIDTEATDDDDSDVAMEPAADELPRTASPLALLALLGMGAGSGALGLRRFRRR